MDLNKKIDELIEDKTKLQKSIQLTMLDELKVEVQVYSEECARLRGMLDA